MRQIAFKERYIFELEKFYLSYPEVMKEQGVESLEHFVENMAVYGLRRFQENYRPLTSKVKESD